MIKQNHRPALDAVAKRIACAASVALLLGTALSAEAKSKGDRGLNRIKNIIVIYQENWSFDALYGQFPGADGYAYSFPYLPQLDKSTNYSSYIYQTPQPKNGTADNRFPPANGQAPLPLIPYDFTAYASAESTTGDLVHRFYTEQLQIDNGVLEPSDGPLSKFVTWSDNPGLVLSYADATGLPEGKLAQQYTLCDHFFHSAYGGSFLNHQFFVAAAAPRWNQPIPAGFQSSYDPATKTLRDNNLTTDGQYVVNTTYSAVAPHPSNVPAEKLLAPINNIDASASDYMPTIGNRLDAAGVNWRWYSGGWNDAVAGNADPLFQFHHQPFAYYAKYAPYNVDGSVNQNNVGPGAHLQDEQQFLADLANGKLPAVSFIKPLGPDNEHPGYAALERGQQHVADLVGAIQRSRYWKDSAIIVTYDENGGRFDHVPPPVVDSWGVGVRVPGIIISPFARPGYVDHTQYETVSILKLIEKRWQLAPLSARDANPAVSDLTSALVQ